MSSISCHQKRFDHLIKSGVDCSSCEGEHLCLAFGLNQVSIGRFRSMVKERGPYQAGDLIYRQQDKFTSLFSIQSGSVKTETVTVDGKPSVLGFHLPGDLFGINAIGTEQYPNDAVAMEHTVLCEIPYQPLLDLCTDQPDLQNQFIKRLGSKIHTSEYSWKIVRNESASHRVMFFLYQLYERQLRDGIDSPRVRLPMSKQDLASFLSLTPESFSRALSQLQNNGHILKESQRILVLQHRPSPEDINNLVLPDVR